MFQFATEKREKRPQRGRVSEVMECKLCGVCLHLLLKWRGNNLWGVKYWFVQYVLLINYSKFHICIKSNWHIEYTRSNCMIWTHKGGLFGREQQTNESTNVHNMITAFYLFSSLIFGLLHKAYEVVTMNTNTRNPVTADNPTTTCNLVLISGCVDREES